MRAGFRTEGFPALGFKVLIHLGCGLGCLEINNPRRPSLSCASFSIDCLPNFVATKTALTARRTPYELQFKTMGTVYGLCISGVGALGFGASEGVGGATFLVLYKGCYGVYPLAAYSGPYPESPNDTTTWEAEGAGSTMS